MFSTQKLGKDRELKALKDSQHPFILKYIHEGEHDGKLCIVT
jgi:hypothetical protein